MLGAVPYQEWKFCREEDASVTHVTCQSIVFGREFLETDALANIELKKNFHFMVNLTNSNKDE